MARARLTIIFSYLAALGAAIVAGYLVRDQHPLLILFVADTAGTIVIFAFSVTYRNASFYDPYWSVGPIAIAGFWLWWPENAEKFRFVRSLWQSSWRPEARA